MFGCISVSVKVFNDMLTGQKKPLDRYFVITRPFPVLVKVLCS